MTDLPVSIPDALVAERAVRNLVTQWRNLHLRHRECRKRISWKNAKASLLEKKRRKEKWEITARVLEIERQLITWLGKATKHPSIYTPKRGTTPSRLMRLRRMYDRNRRVAHHVTGPHAASQRLALRTKRLQIVAEMRTIIRTWMLALYTAVHPDGHPPKPLPLHPAELVPRKLKRAQRAITQELAA